MPASIKRLGLDAGKLDNVIEGLGQLAAMPELTNQVTLRRELDDGLVLERKTCPLGVLGVVFEARPDALVQIVGLAWKSGNAVLLKGGSEARESNRALSAVIHRVLSRRGLDLRSTVLLEDRADVGALLGLHGFVDLIVARGSSEFVQHVQQSTRIPVMGHAAGVCHLYLHAAADPAMAARVAVDAKCSYPAACNSIEALLWDPGAAVALDAAVAALTAAGVELRGCPQTRARHPTMTPAGDGDWGHEFGALVLAVRQVADMDEALAFIETARLAPHRGDRDRRPRRRRALPDRGRRRQRLSQRQQPVRRRLPLRPGRRGRRQHRQAARARAGRGRGIADLPLAAARRRAGHHGVRSGRPALHAPRPEIVIGGSRGASSALPRRASWPWRASWPRDSFPPPLSSTSAWRRGSG